MEEEAYNKTVAGFSKEKLLKMINFCKMSYGNNDGLLQEAGYKTRSKLIKNGYEILPFFNNQNLLAGFIFAKGKEVSIAYRGTKNLYDICTDLNTSFIIPSFLKDGMCHKGFYDEFISSKPSLYKQLNHYMNKQKLELSDLEINLTGYSMGGALAKICALNLKIKYGIMTPHIATFGDPRVFNFEASTIYNEQLGNKTLRVTQHRQDIVPAVPHGCMGFAHVGQQLRVSAALWWLKIHKIDGYHLAIKNLNEIEFTSNNNVSWFYYPSRMLGALVNTVSKYTVAYKDDNNSYWSNHIKQEESNQISR